MRILRRYLRLYGYFLKFSFMKLLQFRFDFTFRIVMDLVFYAVNYFFFDFLFHHTDTLAGWTKPEIIIFVGSYLVIDAIFMTFVTSNLWQLPVSISKGKVDFYLVRPVSTLFFLSFQEIALNSLINFAFALGILVFGIWNYPGNLTFMQLGILCLGILNGALLYYLLFFATVLPSFWTGSPSALKNFFFSASRLMERPDNFFKFPMRYILLFLLPFGAMSSLPARIAFGKATSFETSMLALITLFWLTLIAILWKKALKAYTSASS